MGVQEATRKVPGMRQAKVVEEVRGGWERCDGGKAQGQWYPIGVAVDVVSGMAVAEAQRLREWPQPVAEADVCRELLLGGATL